METKTYRLNPAKLRAARGQRTQVEIAERAGIGQGLYSKIESGQRPDPFMSTALRIARALGVDVRKLVD